MDAERFLDELRTIVELTDRLAERRLDIEFWKPRAASVFGRELTNSEVGKHGQPWGEAEPKLAYEAAWMYVTGVRSRLHSMARLLHPPIPALDTATIARSVFEGAANVYWLMDPTISVRARVARVWAAVSSEAERRIEIATALGDALKTADAESDRDAILTHIDELAIPISGKGLNRKVGGERIPGRKRAVTAMFEHEIPQGREIIYSLYSSDAHNELGGLLRRLVAPAPRAQPVWTVRPSQLVENVELTAVAFRAIYKRLRAGGMGVRRDLEFELWEQNVGRRLGDIKRRRV